MLVGLMGKFYGGITIVGSVYVERRKIAEAQIGARC